ncbi:hypothetical protein BG011_003863 [Mortierella polycephala]|uniref:Uncharacterized protein n=1 Tax=Mortierella polycephala TaxID=41804 RepID=A0A9P6Q1A1_9FUNG|nr:hypothetical protein BG011_003863 [Mortierella polycephala]
MTNVQSKLITYGNMVPVQYMSRIKLEIQRTLLVALSLLRTHRRKALLLSMAPSTILKFITVLLPIIKLLPPTIKAIKALGYVVKSGGRNKNRNGNSPDSNGQNALANREASAAAAAEGFGRSVDELYEIMWTPADDMYWERASAMVTRYGLCKTLGVTLAGVRPGRVEVIMPFRTEVSGERASLVPTLIALTSQLTGLTLLPRHFTLKPIDFKCNILSDCDASTYLLLSRGAVIVRGDHSVTVKVEILKASGVVSGSKEVVSPPTMPSATPSMFSWKSWIGPSSGSTSPSSPTTPTPSNAHMLVPGTGIERSKFVVCASGMQTSVVVRADTDPDNEEENEMRRLRKEREQRRQYSSSSSYSSSSTSLGENDFADDSIVLGDSFKPHSSRPMSPSVDSPKVQQPPNQEHQQQQHDKALLPQPVSDSLDVISPSASTLTDHTQTQTTPTTVNLSTPLSYASAARYGLEHDVHRYEDTSDIEAWQQ